MTKKIIWTKSQARLKQLRTECDESYNWLFLPGGPGLGSESLSELTHNLHLPGTMWHVDFPGDGSNVSANMHFSNWQTALIEAVSEVENVILVAHSSGGMFALATPELEDIIKGLVLMDSAPNADWQHYFSDYVNAHPLADALKLQEAYQKNPSNELLKLLTVVCAPYFSTKNNQKKMVNMLASLPFNCESHLWAERHFDQQYEAKWIPKNIPTLIFAGDQDHITPLKLFTEAKHFQRNNIIIKEIKDASHFPWMDNPMQIQSVFVEYYQLIQSKKRTQNRQK